MARADYKDLPPPPVKSGLPRWAVITIALIVTAFVAFLYFLNSRLPVVTGEGSEPPERADLRLSRPGSGEAQPAPREEKPQPPPKPEFEFYDMLPKLEVVLPGQKGSAVVEPAPKLAPLPLQPVAPPVADRVATAAPSAAAESAVRPSAPSAVTLSAGRRYLLQVGSFRKREDAEQRRVSLMLMGMEATIQSASVNGVQWHRVRVGPYSDGVDLDQAKRQLRDNRIDFMAIKQ